MFFVLEKDTNLDFAMKPWNNQNHKFSLLIEDHNM